MGVLGINSVIYGAAATGAFLRTVGEICNKKTSVEFSVNSDNHAIIKVIDPSIEKKNNATKILSGCGTLCFSVSLYALASKCFPKLWGLNQYCISALFATTLLNGSIFKGEFKVYKKGIKAKDIDKKLYYLAETLNLVSAGIFLLAATKWSSNKKQMRLNGFATVGSLIPLVTKLIVGYPPQVLVTKNFPKNSNWAWEIDKSFNTLDISKDGKFVAHAFFKDLNSWKSFRNSTEIKTDHKNTHTIIHQKT